MTSMRNIITTAVFTGIFSCSILALAEEPAPDHSLSAADETSFTVDWYDTLYSAGILKVPVTYEIADGMVTQSEDITPLNDSQTWTVWHGFDVMDNPENGMPVYRTNSGEVLRLTGLQLVSGHRWIQGQNEQGDTGWFMDPEEFISETLDGDSILYGYFKEAVFAG